MKTSKLKSWIFRVAASVTIALALAGWAGWPDGSGDILWRQWF